MNYLQKSLLSLCLLCALLTYGQTAHRSPSMFSNNSISQNTQQSEEHQFLMAALEATELSEVLDKQGPFTVFAPSDDAFAQLTAEEVESLLLPENKNRLKRLMTYHIVAGDFSASRILKAMCRGGGVAKFTTVQGNELLATMEGIDIVLTDCSGNQAKITVADSTTSNGVIHKIDRVILPN